MAFKVFTLLINGLVPVIPAWFIMNSHPETAVIKPWPIVWTLLGINVLLMLIAWKHLGYTRRQRETEALMLIVNAFVPLATYNWLFPAETQFSFPMQILLYCFMQVVWIVSIEIAPDWVGRIRQRKAEERALSGKQHFESREEVLKKHQNKAEKRSRSSRMNPRFGAGNEPPRFGLRTRVLHFSENIGPLK